MFHARPQAGEHETNKNKYFVRNLQADFEAKKT